MKLPVMLALLALASPALASQSASWGATTVQERSSIQLLPGTDGAFIDVLCVNMVTGGHPNNQQFDLSLGGVDVTVFVYSPTGDIPDIYTIAVPMGYYADPPEIEIDEGGSGVVRIYLEWGV
jgi:hypothetical protein